MKNYYLITKEATKYWKKAIKNDRVMVANYDGKIYVVNGYNAFRFPAMPLLWDELARPAFMAEMPADGAAVEYLRGEARPGNAAAILLPVRISPAFAETVRDTFGGLLEA